MKLISTTGLLFFLLAIHITIAQKPPMKFGKIDIENLKMTHYQKDSSANAVVLCDYGNVALVYNDEKGFQMIYDHHIRIKIFNKAGYKWADAQEYLYHKNSNTEKLTQIRGITYNLEKGKIVKSKLSNQSIFEEKYDKNTNIKKFTMPNVKEGCIIEYSYKLISDYTFNLQNWEFQKSIPVVWSEFRTGIPRYYNYQKIAQGYLPFAIATNSQISRTFRYKAKGERDLLPSDVKEYERNYLEFTERLVVKDAPAFIEEPYMTTSNNYVSKVKYELASTDFPSSGYKNIMGTWKKLNEQFLEDEHFGRKVIGSLFLKKELEIILANTTDDNSKIQAIYDYVKKNVVWDKNYRKLVSSNFKITLKTRKGSSADINIMLTSLLVKAGFVASPVLISTRDNGIVRESIPISNQFNYVICKVNIGTGYILLDATDPFLPLDILPQRCLNGKGWVVSKNNSGWINLNTKVKAITQISGNLDIASNGIMSGDLTYKYKGYNSRTPHKKYLTDGEEAYISEKMEKSVWEIDELSLENANNLSQPFVEKYSIDMMGGAENLGGRIYLTPVVSNRWNKNPFKLEKREYPVDFGYPIGEKYYVIFTIPEGYEIEETPKPKVITLPERSGKYVFNISIAGNKITVMNILDINKSQFNQLEYAYIKEFFAQIVSKQKEQIILKKI